MVSDDILSFKICVFQVVKSPHSRRDRFYCYRHHAVKAGSTFSMQMTLIQSNNNLFFDLFAVCLFVLFCFMNAADY